MKKKRISIVIPVHNEEKNIPFVYDALRDVWNELPHYEYEIIFVNDGSADRSDLAVESIAASDKGVTYIEFSRNFGKEAATSAGIHAATGDAVMMLDADMQHPPALIPLFIEKWEQGAEVVVGVRKSNIGEGFVKKYGSLAFYALMRMISETRMESGETDFRLIDRMVADAFCKLTERARMTRSLINWFGFRTKTVPFDASERLHGVAAYSTVKLIRLALYGIASNSLFPLRVVGYLGVIISSLSFLGGSVVFVNRYILQDPLNWHISGPAQLAIINVFLIGIVLTSLGLIALYIGKIDREVTGRPLYVVRKRI